MEDFLNQSYFWAIIVVAALWTLPWKGVALWRSARNGHLFWFIFFILVNSLAVFEIIYILFLSKKRKKESSREDNLS